jgi:hypothetical protein
LTGKSSEDGKLGPGVIDLTRPEDAEGEWFFHALFCSSVCFKGMPVNPDAGFLWLFLGVFSWIF